MITIPARLTREFIEKHPEWTFVHSTNAWFSQRVGPASICRGLSNCYGIPVRWSLCKTSGYFQDSQRELIIPLIDETIAKIPADKPIILFPKIGNGHSRLATLAPKVYAHLSAALAKIATPVKYDYTGLTS